MCVDSSSCLHQTEETDTHTSAPPKRSSTLDTGLSGSGASGRTKHPRAREQLLEEPFSKLEHTQHASRSRNTTEAQRTRTGDGDRADRGRGQGEDRQDLPPLFFLRVASRERNTSETRFH